jgi:hypothetical protein
MHWAAGIPCVVARGVHLKSLLMGKIAQRIENPVTVEKSD